jgi:hypothetical protein
MAGGRDSAGTIADEIMAATTEVADWDKFPNLRPGIASVKYFSVIQVGALVCGLWAVDCGLWAVGCGVAAAAVVVCVRV